MPVTYQDVCKAADQLRKRNMRVSVRAVTSITRGSHTQIGPLVEQWKRDNPQGLPSLPDKVLKPIIDHLMELQASHEQDLQEEVDNSQLLQEEIEKVKCELNEANKEKLEAEFKLKSEKHRADRYESNYIELDSKVRNLENELSSQRGLIKGLENANESLKQSNQMLIQLASRESIQ